MLRLLRPLGFLLVVMPVAACSGKVAEEPLVAADKASFIEQVCEAQETCCAPAGLPSARTQCRTQYESLFANATYDASRGSQCVLDVRAHASSGALCASGTDFYPSSCADVFRSNGSKKPGELCDTQAECAPSSEGRVVCSESLSTDMARVCQVQVIGKLGDGVCIGDVDGGVSMMSGGAGRDGLARVVLCNVRDGLRCDDATSRCVPIGKVGERCSGTFHACTKDAWCSGGTCVARNDIGTSCSDPANDDCVAGAYCARDSFMCVRALTEGQACDTSNQCASGNCHIGKCGPAIQVTLWCGR